MAENEDFMMGEGAPVMEAQRRRVEETFGTKVAEATDISGDKYALSPSWQAGRNYRDPFDYYLEGSKQMLNIRRLDMGDLLKLGIAEELDFMSKALMTESKPEESAKESVMSAVYKSDNFSSMETMINRVCVEGINRPKVHSIPPPILDEEGKEKPAIRQKGLFYVDYIPFPDRMELFSVIFDSEGLSTFRSEQTAGVGDVENVTSVSLPAE
jgi:hypothetical protein